jgi:hypothetical protein
VPKAPATVKTRDGVEVAVGDTIFQVTYESRCGTRGPEIEQRKILGISPAGMVATKNKIIGYWRDATKRKVALNYHEGAERTMYSTFEAARNYCIENAEYDLKEAREKLEQAEQRLAATRNVGLVRMKPAEIDIESEISTTA